MRSTRVSRACVDGDGQVAGGVPEHLDGSRSTPRPRPARSTSRAAPRRRSAARPARSSAATYDVSAGPRPDRVSMVGIDPAGQLAQRLQGLGRLVDERGDRRGLVGRLAASASSRRSCAIVGSTRGRDRGLEALLSVSTAPMIRLREAVSSRVRRSSCPRALRARPRAGRYARPARPARRCRTAAAARAAGRRAPEGGSQVDRAERSRRVPDRDQRRHEAASSGSAPRLCRPHRRQIGAALHRRGGPPRVRRARRHPRPPRSSAAGRRWRGCARSAG